MRQTWVCWWYLQWSYALADRRQSLWAAEARREALDPSDPAYEILLADDNKAVLRAERRVTRALAKRAKWKARGACENCRRAAARLDA